ncbi:MAG: SWIM zinc finger family protein [Bacteroidota bacterium]
MTIHDFEIHIDKTILNRGRSYYGNEYIEEVLQVEKGEFEAVVLGSEEYNVFVKLDESQRIVESHCTCPYDWGDVCKHEAAVYYYIRDNRMYRDQISKEASDLMYKVDSMSVDELKTTLYNILKRHRALRQVFLGEELED